MPEFVRSELGERALQRANHAAGFDAELIEGFNFFIPQQSVLAFVDAVARTVGNGNLGLLFAPAMDVSAYGAFGRYITGAATLGEALERSIAALPYHSSVDSLIAMAVGDELRFSYKFALSGSPGYETAACCAAGELLSVFRVFLPDHWHPLRIELDIPTPCHTSLFEDVFQCPVTFNAPAVTVVAERYRLMTPSKRPVRSILTLEDVARERPGGAPRSVIDVTTAQIRTQLQTGSVSIEDVAQAMDTSVRTLQRELQQTGTDFRTLTSSVRIQRAAELLRSTGVSITSISEDLGYSSPTGFSRAFHKVTGFGPREYRAKDTA